MRPDRDGGTTAVTESESTLASLGVIRTKWPLSPACHGKIGRSTVSVSSSISLMGRAAPLTTTLQARPVSGSKPSASKATRAVDRAAKSLVP